jgi:hypothetical protein
VEFVAIPSEKRMFKNLNNAVTVAGRSTACARLAFSTKSHANIIINTRWYGHFSFYSDLGEPVSSAI